MADDLGPAGEVAVARETLLRGLVAFARELRRRGASVPPDATLTAAQALTVVGLDDRDRVRTALRAALVSRREDLALFDELFDAFWRQVTGDDGDEVAGGINEALFLPDLSSPESAAAGEAPEDDEAGIPMESRREPAAREEPVSDPADEDDRHAVYSPTGRPEPVEAAPGLARPADELETAVRELKAALAALRGRRWEPGGDVRPDVRRALRRSIETGGTVLDLPGRTRRDAGVRAVLLVDVSRSVLDTVDRGFLLAFVRAVRDAWRDVTVFFFDTDVREVSEAFDARTPGGALSALEAAEAAWGGGTRIGHAVASVRRDHPMVVDRDTVVLIVSDGLEVGEIDVLEREMAWLSRRAAAVLWANPLAASPAYEPTCRGMAAALPFVDGLFAFATPDDVVEMARQLGRHGPGDRVGYEHDARRRAPDGPESDRSPEAVGPPDGRA